MLGVCGQHAARLFPTSRTVGLTQRSQYPLIQEYTLNHNTKDSIFKVYSLIKGYWVLWVGEVQDCSGSGFGVIGYITYKGT